MAETQSAPEVEVMVRPDDPLAWLSPVSIGELVCVYSKPCPTEDKNSDEYREWAAEVTEMASKEDAKVGKVLGEIIWLRHIFSHKVKLLNVDPETKKEVYVDGYRTVLLDADGMRISCVSQTAVQGLTMVLQLFGHPSTWTEPVPVRFQQEEGSSKERRVYTVTVVKPSELRGETKTKGKK